MRSPKVGKPRVAPRPASLSGSLPKLRLPTAPASTARPRPQVGRPPKPLAGKLVKR